MAESHGLEGGDSGPAESGPTWFGNSLGIFILWVLVGLSHSKLEELLREYVLQEKN